MHLYHPNRRELMQMSAGTLLAAGLWPGALTAEGKSSGKEFSFIVVNDTHYIDQDCDNWITKVFKQVIGHTPSNVDFCLLVSDVTDDGNATTDQMAAMRDHIKTSGLTVYPVVGNHDYSAEIGRKAYEESFPKRINYQFEHQGWQFIGLDRSEANLYKDTERSAGHAAPWLDEQLPKLDKKKPTILFTHFPLSPAKCQAKYP